MRTLIVLFALCPLLAACGSSDGSGTGGVLGPEADEGLFTGNYAFALYAGRSNDSDSTYVDWGPLASDGSFVSGQKTRNQWNSATPTADSQIASGLPVGPLPFLAGVSRRVVIEGELCLDGALARNGHVAVFSAQRAGDDPAIAAAVKLGSGMSNAALSGTYHLLGISHNHAPQGRTVLAGTAVFDGAGNLTVDFMANTDGSIGGPIGSAATYALSADGSLSLQIATSQLEGALSPDGHVAVLGGNATTANTERQLVILIRAAAGATNALFAGRYRRVGLSSLLPSAGSGWTGLLERNEADGTGQVARVERQINGDGLLIRFVDILGASYTVDPDGGFDGGLPSGAAGGIAPDGDFAAVALLVPGVVPRLDLLVRTAAP